MTKIKNRHKTSDSKIYLISIIFLNLLQGIITYLNSQPNYSPAVDIAITILLAFAVNAFIAFVIFLVIGLIKKTFYLSRYIKTFAFWSFSYLIVIIIDAFLL